MSDELSHHGVKGMKWGVRRSQAALDRAAGRRATKEVRRQVKQDNKTLRKNNRVSFRSSTRKTRQENLSKLEKDVIERAKNPEYVKAAERYNRVQLGKKIVTVAAGVALSKAVPALATGAYSAPAKPSAPTQKALSSSASVLVATLNKKTNTWTT